MQKRFSLLLVVRVMLLLTTTVLLARILGRSTLFFNQVALGILLAAQTGELIYFVNETNRSLTRFFQSIVHTDFSTTFHIAHRGKSFRGLEESMVVILDTYKKVQSEREAQYKFLHILVNQLPMGVIVCAGNEIILINSAAEKLLRLEGFKNWELVRVHHPALTQQIDALGARGRSLVELATPADTTHLSVDVDTVMIQERAYKLITAQDIHSEIEQKEVEAWHKLIRILTHEIMNSVTPIASLSETLQGMLTEKDGTRKAALSPATIGDVHFALQTIFKRSEGLQQFVEHYRTLTRVPRPEKQVVPLEPFLRQIAMLMDGILRHENIALHIAVTPPHASGFFDPKLIEQVLINLIGNSIHALQNRVDKTIRLEARIDGNSLLLEVFDNGHGISEKELKDIFIPFFSTKKEGTGIGLSLSKQIMSLHGGSIRASAQAGFDTTFTLRFPGKT